MHYSQIFIIFLFSTRAIAIAVSQTVPHTIQVQADGLGARQAPLPLTTRMPLPDTEVDAHIDSDEAVGGDVDGDAGMDDGGDE